MAENTEAGAVGLVLSVPALSMWQPWATALVRGIKRLETRPRRLGEKYLGKRIYIQAAQKLPRWGGDGPTDMSDLVQEVVTDHFGPHWGLELPRGAIIGHVVFDAMYRTENIREKLTQDELLLGNWTDGRWAYHVKEVVEYSDAVPAKGAQAVPFPITDPKTISELVRITMDPRRVLPSRSSATTAPQERTAPASNTTPTDSIGHKAVPTGSRS